ncbi:MAG TPA: hypothetical protein VJA22_03160, partial [Patescibacteria group bacterium]|nr:hypothetical protein [Patescibacteria group bacterium]
EKVVEAVQNKHPSVHHVSHKKKALTYLMEHLRPNDVVVVMAVGSFNELAYDLRDALRIQKKK